MISKFRVVLVLLLCAFTWYAIQVSGEVERVPIKKSLSTFPHAIGEYKLSKSFQSSAEVLEMLGVDDYIQYNYVHQDGTRINVYVGYYEAVGMGGSYHSPKNCIPGGGWGIDTVSRVVLDQGLDGEKTSEISEMLIRRANTYQVVYYWYQNRGRIIASEYWEKIHQVLDALFKGRRDGTFVRIMLAVPGQDIAQAEEILKNFSEQVMNILEQHIPGAAL